MNITEGVRTTMENPNGYTHEKPAVVELSHGSETGFIRIQPNVRKAIK